MRAGLGRTSRFRKSIPVPGRVQNPILVGRPISSHVRQTVQAVKRIRFAECRLLQIRSRQAIGVAIISVLRSIADNGHGGFVGPFLFDNSAEPIPPRVRSGSTIRQRQAIRDRRMLDRYDRVGS